MSKTNYQLSATRKRRYKALVSEFKNTLENAFQICSFLELRRLGRDINIPPKGLSRKQLTQALVKVRHRLLVGSCPV